MPVRTKSSMTFVLLWLAILARQNHNKLPPLERSRPSRAYRRQVWGTPSRYILRPDGALILPDGRIIPPMSGAANPTVSFMEAGTDETFNTAFYTTVAGTLTSDSGTVITGARSMKCAGFAATGSVASAVGVLASAGRRCHTSYRNNSIATQHFPMAALDTTNAHGTWFLAVTTAGALVLANNSLATLGSTSSGKIAANTNYDISVCHAITSTTVYDIKVYLNGVQVISVHNGTALNFTDCANLWLGNYLGVTVGQDVWIDNVYVDQGTDFSDPGLIRVTAKRPFSNGTTNGFTLTGAGSSYGTGNAVGVNERPQADGSFTSVIAAGVTVEEYSVETISVGDVDVQYGSIVDIGGWIRAKALLSETASMILKGATSNVALTSTTAYFQAYAGSSVYPVGGTDIGLQTTSLATTVTLYECGILIAYIPFRVPPPTNVRQAAKRASSR